MAAAMQRFPMLDLSPVCDNIGRTPLFFGADDSQPSILTRPGGGSLMVETTTLDDFASRHQRPNLVKVDV
jgi:hypothetical protein